MPYIDLNNPLNGAFATPQVGIAEDFVSQADWEKLKPQVVQKDSAAFRRWRLADPDFKALLREEGGLVLALQDAIEKTDYESALTLWNDLSAATNFAAVQAKLFHPETGKLKEFGYQDLIDYVAANPPA